MLTSSNSHSRKNILEHLIKNDFLGMNQVIIHFELVNFSSVLIAARER
jgi:hypothetical protein